MKSLLSKTLILRWLPSFGNGKLISSDPGLECDAVMVEDLIVEGKWKLDKVERWLMVDEVEAILRIPLPMHQMQDSLVWAGDKKGVYSVKGGGVSFCQESFGM